MTRRKTFLSTNKMNPVWACVLLVLAIAACKGTQNLEATSISEERRRAVATDTFSLSIEAINLSEDMSPISTQNDEILVLFYAWKDSASLDQYLLSRQLKFDAKNRVKEIQFPLDKGLLDVQLQVFLLEQDAETPIEQIDPILRIHHKAIQQAFKKKDYWTIEKYLGDEDVLGIELIPELKTNTPVELNFSGIYKMDKYEYAIRIRR